MKKVLHRADTRGSSRADWLDSKHSFSFADYHNRERMQFGALRVLNDDIIKGGHGFDFHGHQNMEIVTIPLFGTLLHKDNLGHEELLTTGEVQVMSAGTGIVHGEWNASEAEDCGLLQIWLKPNKYNILPRYEQKKFSSVGVIHQDQLIVSPDGRVGSLAIQQDAFVSLIILLENQTDTYKLVNSTHGLYVFVIEGAVIVEEETVLRRDAIGLWDLASVEIKALESTQLLLLEVPMN